MNNNATSRRSGRNRALLLSASALVGVFASYGRDAQAQSACANTGGSNYLCSGVSISSESINATDATVTTDAPLSVNVSTGDAISITGDGDISFVDPANSGTVLSAPNDKYALDMTATGDSESGGSLTIDTAATISGTGNGIRAHNRTTGDMNVTVNGDIDVARRGIDLRNDEGSGDLNVTIDGSVSGQTGAWVSHYGVGGVDITVNGDLTGIYGDGLEVRGYSSNGESLNFTSSAGSTITGIGTAVDIRWYGSGAADINIDGDLGGSFRLYQGGSGSTDIDVNGAVSEYMGVRTNGDIDFTMGESGSARAVTLQTRGDSPEAKAPEQARDVNVDIYGTIGDGNYGSVVGLGAVNLSVGGDIDINVGETASVSSHYFDDNEYAIFQEASAILAANLREGSGDITITTEAGSNIRGESGIVALQNGKYSGKYDLGSDGEINITVAGDVIGEGNDGIRAVGGTGTTISVLAGASVTSNGGDNDYAKYEHDTREYYYGTATETVVIPNQDRAIEIVGASGNVTVAGTVVGGAGGAIVFDAVGSLLAGEYVEGPPPMELLRVEDPYGLRTAYDDRLELQAGYSITGIVDAGGGTNTLALGGETGEASFDISLIDVDGIDDESAQYFGFNRFLKEGASTWTLTGANSDLTEFGVNGGLLYVNGSAPNLAVSAAEGTMIGGTGTVGDIALAGGATLAPGSFGTIGTLTASSATFEQGSIFAIDLLPDGSSDLLNVVAPSGGGMTLFAAPASGAVTINGGTIAINGPTAIYSNATRWTIISAQGGVTGTFDTITDNLPDISFYDIYRDPNLVQLAVEQDDGDLSDKANAPASATGAGFAAMNFARSLAQFAAGAGSDGAGLGSTAAFRDALDPTESGLANLAQSGGSGARGFGTSGIEFSLMGLANSTKLNSDYSGPGFDADTYGGAAMIGYRTTNANGGFSIGIGGGYTTSDVDTAAGKGEVDTTHVGLYSGYRNGGLSFKGALSYGWLDADLTRSVIPSVSASARTEGTVYSGYLELGYDVLTGQVRNDLSATPFLRLRGYRSKIDGYQESGAGILNLTVQDIENEVLFGGVGIRLARTFGDVNTGFSARPYVSVAFEHEFLGDDSSSFSTLAAVPGSGFSTPVGVGNEELFTGGLGVQLMFGHNFDAYFNYEGSTGERLEEHRGTLGLSYRF